MTSFIADGRDALRRLGRTPGYTVIAVLTLALGIGTTTAVFSLINGVLLRPLPYRDAHRVVTLAARSLTTGEEFPLSYQQTEDWRRAATSFDAAAFWVSNQSVVQTPAGPAQVRTAMVGDAFFDVLGATPLAGRLPDARDPAPALAISYAFWQREFAGAAVLGRPLIVSGRTYTIAAIATPEFRYPAPDVSLWTPLRVALAADTAGELRGGGHFFFGIAHLRDGAALGSVQAEMTAIARRSLEPGGRADQIAASVVPLDDRLLGDLRRPFIVLFAGVVLVLLIACANVANLTLARVMTRESETAIRVALGAAPRRLLQFAAAESLLVAGAGGLIGALLAAGAIRAVRATAAASLPRLDLVSLDLRVLLFAAGVSLVAGLASGLLPALHLVASGPAVALKDAGRSAGASRRTNRIRVTLAVAEVAVSFVLLVGAALLGRSLLRLLAEGPLLRTDRVVSMKLLLPPEKYTEDARVAAFYHDLLDRTGAQPGIEAVGIATSLPPSFGEIQTPYTIEDAADASAGDRLTEYISASSGYFRALGVPLVAGRLFDDRDRRGGERVVLINEWLAGRAFKGISPIGRRLKLAGAADVSPWRTIVGVVGDVKYSGLATPQQAAVYVPYSQATYPFAYVLVRTRTGAFDAARAVERALHELDPAQPLSAVETMDRVLADAVAQPRFRAMTLTAFGALALLLASIGLYGVITYSVTRRTREIGVRMALGARPSDILAMVVREGGGIGVAGIAIGAAAAIWLSRFLESLLFGIAPLDRASFAGVGLVLLAVTLFASVWPAWRASALDPLEALRE